MLGSHEKADPGQIREYEAAIKTFRYVTISKRFFQFFLTAFRGNVKVNWMCPQSSLDTPVDLNLSPARSPSA